MLHWWACFAVLVSIPRVIIRVGTTDRARPKWMIITGTATGRLVRRHTSTTADGHTITATVMGRTTDRWATIEADGAIAEDIEADSIVFNRFESRFCRM